MLKDYFWPKVLRTEEYKKNCFQQDSALPRTAMAVQTWLKGQFAKKFTVKVL